MGNLIDETGNQYGYLTVLKRAENIVTPNGRSHVAWLCKCECGNEVVVRGSNLRGGCTKSCGCHQYGNRVIDETGNKYGRLTVLKRVGSDQDKKALWLCQCDCGNTTVTSGKRLRNGTTNSCGCINSIKETIITQLLTDNKIIFTRQFYFDNLKNITPLRFDFAIYNSNLKLVGLIEYNGEQHYLTYERGRYTFEVLEKIKRHDKMKINYCKEHNIPLLILNKDNYNEEMILEWINNKICESEGETL